MNSIRPKLAAGTGRRATALAAAVALLALPGCAMVVRVSQSVDHIEGNSASRAPSVSFDGRWIAFTSFASNLTGNDFNGTADVFVRDQQSGAVELLSRTAAGLSANYASDQPSISDDGNRIAFRSVASNLVADPALALTEIYVRDRAAGTTTWVSVATNGTSANGPCSEARISRDGRYVTFTSTADNLVANDGNHQPDVFVHDLVTGTTEAVSVMPNGMVGAGASSQPAINQDGRYIAFTSTTPTLVPGDGNGGADVFLRDRTGGTTTRVSVTTAGLEAEPGSGSPAISADGRVIAFDSTATDLIAHDVNQSADVFVRNLNTLVTTMVSVDNGNVPTEGSSHTPSISADARYVSFTSWGQLVPDDENYLDDIYVRDRSRSRTRRISTTVLGDEVHDPNEASALSGDGRSVAFQSISPQLVDGDDNHVEDVFVKPVTVPTVTGTSPASVAHGTSTTVTVTGTGFLPGTTVLIPVDGVTVGAVTIQSETKLTVQIAAGANATNGPAFLWVVLPGTGPGVAVSSATLAPFAVT